jgi:cellulose biosynthesis protein BcsE
VSAASNHFNRDTAVGPLGRLRAWARAVFARRTPEPSRLAIEALPDELARLAPGGLYVVYVRARRPDCDALIWESARQARTRHVTVVLARAWEETAAHMRELGFAVGTPARGWPRNLNVLAMTGGAQAHPAEEDPADDPTTQMAAEAAEAAEPAEPGYAPAFARLVGGLRALKRFGLHANALYFVEGAERWFNWDDPAALAREGQLLADWCVARKITVVLMLRPMRRTSQAPYGDATDAMVSEERFDDEASYEGRNEFHGVCTGVARLRRVHGELLWHVDFWRTGPSLVTGEVHSLRFTENGRLTVAPETATAQDAKAAMLARDEDRVIATRAVVANETWVPGDWEIVDDLDAAIAACNGAVAATVLLDYTGATWLEPLCAAAHRLRRECGRALKIVVVERRYALRHQYEILLSSLGVNLLFGRDVPFSRMLSLMRSLQGQVDTRPIVDDYRASLAAALTDAVRGYLSVDAFCSYVREVLKRGALLRLPHVLAKLTLVPQAAHVDALQDCIPHRTGDVFTSDAAHVYVFLFACRIPDAEAALARIIETHASQWFDDILFLSGESVEREMKALAESNRRMPAADYSDLFAKATMQSQPSAKAEEHVRHAAQSQAQAHSKVRAAAQAQAELEALERVLAEVDGHETDVGDIGLAPGDGPGAPLSQLLPSRRRYVERCSMPLRATEEK